MRLILTCLLLFSLSLYSQGQSDTSNHYLPGKISFKAYMDLYYSVNLNDGSNQPRPYAVASNQMNIFTINLAYLQVNYESDRLRSRITPAFGTYMNANYTQAPGGFRFLMEANAGYRLSRKKQFWLDAGIIASPYTNENAVSKEHLTYTRSLSAEQTPYYLSGIKLTYPFSERLSLAVYAINGWQEIADPNAKKALATQLSYKKVNRWTFNWSTYLGNEKSDQTPDYRYRFFNDFNFVLNTSRLKLASDAYIGRQNSSDSLGLAHTHWWWQANLAASLSLGPVVSLVGRVEYFNDPYWVIVMPLTSASGFQTFGTSLGINLKVQNNIMFRFEGRRFQAKDKVFLLNGEEKNYYNLFTSNMTIWY